MIFVILALVIAIVYFFVDIFWVGWINPPVDGIYGTMTALVLTAAIMGVVQLSALLYTAHFVAMKPTLIWGGVIWFIADWLIRAPDYFGIKIRPPKKHDDDWEENYWR